jgi:ribose transport system ATP-binding protein
MKMGDSAPLLRVECLFKSFGITKALQNVSLELNRGQVLGLMGENGSGKSTLASIIVCIVRQDSGQMFFKGLPYCPRNTVEANKMGVCMIMQEKGTFDHLNVAQNIFIGKEDEFCTGGLLNNKRMYASANEALANVGIDTIPADKPIGKLGFEDRKLVELARAFYSHPDVLIIDETTTALSKRGREILFTIIRTMQTEGKGIIFISHDIDEMMLTCDKIAILRDGNYIDSLSRDQFDTAVIKNLMVGREIAGNYYRTDMAASRNRDEALSVQGICTDVLSEMSFSLYKGEILGVAGLTDCGIHDLGKAIFGALPLKTGTIRTGAGAIVANPQKAMKEKIAYISKDRDQEALMVTANITDNICLPSYFKLKTGSFVLPFKEKNFVSEWSSRLNIKMRDRLQYVRELSGGNKQKVALAKWLGFGADIFVLDCPTRGIDVGVKATIYQLMMDLRSQGKSIILISEELTEIIGMSDRIITIKNGMVSGEFLRDNKITENNLIEHII